MKISGTFLKSKIAQKIAILVFLSTVIPLTLVSWLSITSTSKLIQFYEHQSLVKQSNNHALSVFSNLLIAKKILLQVAEAPNQRATQLFEVPYKQLDIFTSLVHVTNEGKLLRKFNQPDYLEKLPEIIRHELNDIKKDKTQLIILPNSQKNETARILLVSPIFKGDQIQSFLIGELKSKFIWGDITEYPSNINVCTYRIKQNIKTKLFCSSGTETSHRATASGSGAWELFLKGEFNNHPWLFVTNLTSPPDYADSVNIINKKNYIIVALISFLLAGLLSLTRIRTTMVPLEELVSGAKKVADGDYSPVIVDQRSEFSELANAFNKMSASIDEKINTLKTLSDIDSEIATKLNIEVIIDQVLARMHHLKPKATFYIFRIEEKTVTEAHCNVTISSNHILVSKRISIPVNDLAYIKSHELGKIIKASEHSSLIHEKILAEIDEKHFWIMPMYWQNKLNGFIFVGSHQKLHPHDEVWQEYRALARRISIALSTQAREEKLVRQSQQDSLTGLPNRILLEDRLYQAIEHSNRTGNPVWIVFLDLDRFKIINDSMGHQVGDHILLNIANKIKQSIREIDTVARFGGDEFVIILNTEAKGNIHSDVLNRLLNSVAQPIKVEQQDIVITCSIGVSVYPNDSKVPEELIRYADIAMYRAKELGKNNFQFFTDAMNLQAEKQMRVYTLLRGALDRDEFSLVYQPKVDIRTRNVIGVEALIRWHSPELGKVSPLEFIPLAEETSLITTIGEWVIRTACAQAVSWQNTEVGTISMSVNVSSRQFAQSDFLETLNNILSETGLKPENLDLELTESLLFEYSENALHTLNKIKALGISISIDDFGTGFSNLSYLNQLPIDTLKIDKSFIDTIDEKTLKAPIVDIIILLAKSLNLNIVAEGVELLDQVEYLAIRGCHQIQGYYFSPPVRAEIITGMLSPSKSII
ncbi:MAG: EAL domain-containing protein [Methylophilus sp.]